MPTDRKPSSLPTWLDWIGPDEPEPEPLLTRTEFLDRLHAEGLEISYHTLVSWERKGIIPRPIRRWVDGAPHSLYPLFMVPIVRTVRRLQLDGKSLADIRDAIRTIPWLVPSEPVRNRPTTREEQHALSDEMIAKSHEVRRHVHELAHIQERMSGVPVVSTELEMIDAQGNRYLHGFGRPDQLPK